LSPSRPAFLARIPPVVLILVAINAAVELGLLLADLGVIGSPSWRAIAYRHAGFYSAFLHGAHPRFALEPVTMFVTYAFLHGGWLHLLVNMAALISIGAPIVAQIGARNFLLTYMLTAIGGGLCYGLTTDTMQPMVGASGALFGLLGVWICWGYLERRHYREGMRAIWRAIAILVLYNAVFWVLLAGRLAWETHLGGFIAGWIIGLVWGRPIYRRVPKKRDP